jgi:hypothetical protein
VRSLGGEQGLRRSIDHQGLPRTGSSPHSSRASSFRSAFSLSLRSAASGEVGEVGGEGAAGGVAGGAAQEGGAQDL